MTDNLDFIGKHEFVPFVGVVEDISDPLTLGRVRVRCFGFHPEDRSAVPTSDLPWANVLQQSASISGVGSSPNYLQCGSWVAGYFLDGKFGQYPMVWGSIPVMHLPNNGQNVGNSSVPYYGTNNSQYDGPTYGQGTETNQYPPSTLPGTPGTGASIKDDGSYLTSANINNWPLKIYKSSPSRGDQGLACKGGNSNEDRLRIHYATALALEELTKQHGRNLNINSAYRTPSYNARLKGAAKQSLHMRGRAFDIQLGSIGNIYQFAQLAVKNGFVGFGLYNTFMHIDTGTGRTWLGAKSPKFVAALRAAGWYEGKPGLQDVRVSPGTNTANTAPTSLNDTNRDRQESGGTDAADPTTKAGVQQRMTDYYASKGFTKPQIAGILGHAEAESNFNIGANNSNDKGMQSYGIFQWRDRLPALRAYAGTNTPSLQQQLDFSMKEFGSTESRAYNMLKNSSNPTEAARAMSYYERHEGFKNPESSISADRIDRANKFAGGYTATGQVKGFQDPSGSLPYGGYQGKPSTNEQVRGDNSGAPSQENNSIQEAGTLTGFPVAGDIGTFGEPDNTTAPQYPYNIVYASLTGHYQEFDDTPGHERVNLQHKTGSKIEMLSGGSVVQRVKGNSYKMDFQDSYHGVLGDYAVTAVGDVRIRSTSDLVVHADGHYQEVTFNDRTNAISGNFDIIVGDVVQMKAKKVIIEGANIHLYSTGNLNIQAEGDLNLKGKKVSIMSDEDLNVKGKALKVSGSASVDIKSPSTKVTSDGKLDLYGSPVSLGPSNVSLAGVVQANEINANIVKAPVVGGSGSPVSPSAAAEAAAAAEAESADLKKPAERRKVEKPKLARPHPDAVPTTEDSKNNYGGTTGA